MKYNRGLGACAAALAAVGLVACGSSGGGSKGGLTNVKVTKQQVKCGLGNGKAAKGKPIEIRALTTASGGVDFTSSPKAAGAYFACVNANGGINGRPVDYQFKDDGLNPQSSSAIAAGFANDPNVVGLVGDSTFIGCQQANAQYVKKNLYSITGVGVPRACFHASNMAPVNAGPRISALSVMKYYDQQKQIKSVAMMGVNTPGTTDWEVAGVKGYAQAHGIKVVKTLIHDPGLQDAQQFVNNIKAANPDMFLVMEPGPDAVGVLKAGQMLGLKDKMQWSCLASCYDASIPGQIGSYWNNAFVANSELQLSDAKTPDNLLWREVLQVYGKPKYPRDTFSQAGFQAAKIATQALLKLDPNNITRSTVSQAFLDVKNYRSDMLCDPWYFGKAPDHNATHATRMVQVKDGAYVGIGGCVEADDPDLASIRKREQSQGLVG